MATLRKKFPSTEFYMSVLYCIRTQYRGLSSKFPYSVQIKQYTVKKNTFGHFSRSAIYLKSSKK